MCEWLIQQLSNELLSKNISDIHLVAGHKIYIRKQGNITSHHDLILTDAMLYACLKVWLSESAYQEVILKKDIDIRLTLNHAIAFRLHIGHQYQGLSLTLRPLPTVIPSIESLCLPPRLISLLSEQQGGLLLVSGATGSGKSTSLSAMIQYLNQIQALHIITLEDPIERYFPPLKSLIQQREIGRDCLSLTDGLLSAMRQDPDVIMIGELRSPESIRLALTASETGHLVLATLHANTASQTIDRLLDVFPAEEKLMIQQLLSQTLIAVLNQQLMHLNTERVALYELLIATSAVRNLIREGKTAQLPSQIQTGQAVGMQTRAQSMMYWQQTQ